MFPIDCYTMKKAWELLNITVMRLWTAHLQVINNSPRPMKLYNLPINMRSI